MLPVLCPTSAPAAGFVGTPVEKMTAAGVSVQTDVLAVEEPLEIRLGCVREGRRLWQSISVTMRTPGADFELAAGFLLTEGILASPDDIADIEHAGRGHGRNNIVRVELRPGVQVDFDRLARHFYTTSSCGVCGKTSVAAVQVAQQYALRPGHPLVDPAVVHGLPDALRAAQDVFDRTGGLHAAALFTADGTLLDVREDVGRHNAVDKLLGARFLAGQVPCADHVLLVSGRASFELVQKALLAGVHVLAAVGAPSSLAVELARNRGMTVLGFVRNQRFNIYSAPDRIRRVPRMADINDGY